MAPCWWRARPTKWRATPRSRRSISARRRMPELLVIDALRAGYGQAVVLPSMSLSLGEGQVLAIGRALTLNPKVLLLDEPTEGLAPIIVEELLRALGTITRAGGICSVIVEQNAQKILGLADRVVILERGAIVHDAASHALKADPAGLERYLGVAGAAAH